MAGVLGETCKKLIRVGSLQCMEHIVNTFIEQREE